MKNLVNFSILSILVLTFFSCSSVDIPEIPQNIASTSSSSGDSNSSVISSSSEEPSSSSETSSSSSDALSSSSDASSSSSDALSSSSEDPSSSSEEVDVVKVWDKTADTTWFTDNKSASSFVIYTAEQLAGLAKLVNGPSGEEDHGTYPMNGKTITLGKNIMLNDTTNWEDWEISTPTKVWTPIGSSSTNPFRGTFNGGNFVINGVYSNSGLFNVVSGSITNLGVNASCIRSSGGSPGHNSGGLVANNSGTINRSYFVGIVIRSGQGSVLGGLVGSNSGTISNSYSTGMVKINGGDGSGSISLGGLVGSNSNNISNSYSTGTVTGTGTLTQGIGGLAGANSGNISNSYSTGTVTGGTDTGINNFTKNIGGLVGSHSAGTIENSYSTGAATGTSGSNTNNIGGLVGNQTGGTIKTSYFNGSVEKSSDFANNIGGLVGFGNPAKIENSYSIATLRGVALSKVGGLVGGFQNSSTIITSYSVSTLAGSFLKCDGLINEYSGTGTTTRSYYENKNDYNCNAEHGESKSSDEMKSEGTFDDWNFSSLWQINSNINNGYPYLKTNPPRD